MAEDREAPLLLVLHGSGERGEDCRRQLATAGTFLVEPAFQASHPCFVVAPQCPENLNWQSTGSMDVQHAVTEILDELVGTESVDESRIYLIGYSMGAYGCWHYLATMPDRFAGCIAVAGGGDPDTAAAVAETPVWAIHGENDTVVSPAQSQRMVDAVVGAGGDARLTLLQNVDHGSFGVVKQTPNDYLQWLFKQQRSGGGG
ncbi:MAG: alpha/beta fold hydrolase [Novipirellula sp. JB048]